MNNKTFQDARQLNGKLKNKFVEMAEKLYPQKPLGNVLIEYGLRQDFRMPKDMFWQELVIGYRLMDKNINVERLAVPDAMVKNFIEIMGDLNVNRLYENEALLDSSVYFIKELPTIVKLANDLRTVDDVFYNQVMFKHEIDRRNVMVFHQLHPDTNVLCGHLAWNTDNRNDLLVEDFPYYNANFMPMLNILAPIWRAR